VRVNFAGHNDWRLPSEAGHNGPPPSCTTSNPCELETIQLQTPVDPIFGPTARFYWSSTADTLNPDWAFGDYGGSYSGFMKCDEAVGVRAVRSFLLPGEIAGAAARVPGTRPTWMWSGECSPVLTRAKSRDGGI